MRRIVGIAAIATLTISSAFAQLGIRNISSVGIDANFDKTVSIDINQVLLFPVVDWLSAELKVQRQDAPARSETTVSAAPIFIFGNTYVITRYALGIGSSAGDGERTIAHGGAIDANYEIDAVYANAAVRGSFYPADGYWFVIPTVAARVPIGSVSVLGRYFFSYNSDRTAGHAILAEAGVPIGDRFSVKVGATGSVDVARSGDQTTAAWEVSGITGFSFAIRPGLAMRYHLEYLGRLGAVDGIRNILVLDASF